MPSTLDEQLTKYLTDVHSIEEQALTQLRRAPDIAGDPELARVFSEHLTETEDQERRVRERLEAYGADPSKTKDLVARAGGIGMLLFARSQPDTPGKLTAHAYSYEHMELAAYELLARVAERAGDQETVAVAREIAAEEQQMADRIEANFDRAVAASLRDQDPDDLDEQLNSYLSDVHALEGQSKQLLEKSKEMDVPASLAEAFAHHLEETEGHLEKIERRLDDRGASPSAVKDAMLKLGALNWGAFFAAQPDTPAKLAGFSYAVENLEVAAYELLKRVAGRAGDQETVALAESILNEERNAAQQVADQWSVSMSVA